MRLFDPSNSSELTIGEIIQEYLASRVAAHRAGLITRTTLVKKHYYLIAFESHFGTLTVSQARRGDLERFLTLHPEYKSPHTQWDAVWQITGCFRWAVDEGLISQNPYSPPKELPTPQPRAPITRAEVRAMLRTAKTMGYKSSRIAFRLALWFLWETGIRTCELYKLDWSNYDGERGVFTMHSKTTKKTGKDRLIVLPARAWRLIRIMARATAATIGASGTVPILASPANPVFTNGRGRPWTKGTFGKMFRRVADRAGVRGEMTAYCLRHGFTCEALEAGVGERQLADYLGHSSTACISWYGRGIRAKVDYLRETGEKRGKGGISG